MARHVVRRGSEAVWGVPPNLEGHTEGFRRWTVVDESANEVTVCCERESPLA